MSDTTSTTTRSRSRGRELYSTGRGGAGNIHRSDSQGGSPRSRVIDEDAGSPNRGREPPVHVDHITHTGRGGAGNVRSPSREPRDFVAEAAQADYEHKVVENADAKPHASVGRGGAGNIQTPPRSRSRDVNADQPRSHSLQSTGRGGAGNITSGAGEITKLEEEEDLERANHHHQEGIHSTGRGGLANLTDKPTPYETSPPPYPHSPAHQQEYFSSGRGGAGNIRSRSASRDVEKQQHTHGHSHLHNLVEKAKHLA
ncbi:hypothetical protein SCHPADRAFT_836848 [Schizopora paradoxa]|uniref:Uncharacterized protein n=1 Tax=Schizopora paradoxa TaxID=27342 RepID=A0A0H2R7P2_9AGAM|nr:hypothetical protein SCHPADRAFT_836848 [Schizopora paradoxa]